jgi:hypothetical protein
MAGSDAPPVMRQRLPRLSPEPCTIAAQPIALSLLWSIDG